jgi:hypothetical protein
VARRRVRLAFVFGVEPLVRALDFAQARDGISDATGQLFYGLYAAARGRAQLFAQQKLRLAYDARQRVVDFVANVGDEFGYLYELGFMLCDQCAQALLFRFVGFIL